MKPDKFTAKMQEAFNGAIDIASGLGQQEIGNEHFLLSLLAQSEGLVRPILEKMGVAIQPLIAKLEAAAASMPKVHGGGLNHLSATNSARRSTWLRPRWQSSRMSSSPRSTISWP